MYIQLAIKTYKTCSGRVSSQWKGIGNMLPGSCEEPLKPIRKIRDPCGLIRLRSATTYSRTHLKHHAVHMKLSTSHGNRNIDHL